MNNNNKLIHDRIKMEEVTTKLFQKYKECNKYLKWPKNSLGEIISISPRYLLDTVSMTSGDKFFVESLASDYSKLSCDIHKYCEEDMERENIKLEVINLIKLNSAIEDFSTIYELTQFGKSKKQIDNALFVFIRDNMFNKNKDEFRDNLMFDLECFLCETDIDELLNLLFRYFELSKKMHYSVEL